MSENTFSNISVLFQPVKKSLPSAGIHPCTRMGIKGYAWSLHVYAQKMHGEGDKFVTRYAIYGSCGDSSFGPAPSYYSKKYGGNIRAARIFYGTFLKYIEENKFSLIGKKFGL